MREVAIPNRVPCEFWVAIENGTECSPDCPYDGHSARVEVPAHFDALTHATSRVRALHFVKEIRWAVNNLVGTDDLGGVIHRSLIFWRNLDDRAMDLGTVAQLMEMEVQLSKYVARRLTRHLEEVKARAYKEGLGSCPHFWKCE